MHELSICQNLVDAALQELEKLNTPGARLKRVRVTIGGLHQIVPGGLQMAFEVLTQDTRAAGSELDVEQVPVVVECRACRWTGEIALPLFVCGSCGSGDVAILKGKELYLNHLEVEVP